MSLFVLDASVAAKWFLPRTGEPLAEEALALLRRYAAGDIEFAVPDLFWAELGNILWKCVRAGRLPHKLATETLTDILHYSLPTARSLDLADDALAIALATGRSVYDAMYVALAVQRDAAFVTADERLVNNLATHWPVKWLGTV
ncbi:MAG TPA: type II toxin-antitoxin system VapC family toxin [Bryobacteraceae bacterium]|nr:type II toxin-antitoxin system VapC family toxin [Bryobacteraceae bacterium]